MSKTKAGIVILCVFIPIYGLPIIYGLLSFASVGIIAGYGIIMEHNVLQTMIIAFVSHAIIEIIPILYSVAVEMYVNKNMIYKVFFKEKKSGKVRELLKRGTTSYMMIIIPFCSGRSLYYFPSCGCLSIKIFSITFKSGNKLVS